MVKFARAEVPQMLLGSLHVLATPLQDISNFYIVVVLMGFRMCNHGSQVGPEMNPAQFTVVSKRGLFLHPGGFGPVFGDLLK